MQNIVQNEKILRHTNSIKKFGIITCMCYYLNGIIEIEDFILTIFYEIKNHMKIF